MRARVSWPGPWAPGKSTGEARGVAELAHGVVGSPPRPQWTDAGFEIVKHVQFECRLSEPSHCKLSATLTTCRVLIIDNDFFPNENMHNIVKSGQELGDDASEMYELMSAFFNLVLFRVPGIWWKSLATLAIDQLHNVYYAWRMTLKIYLVDVVLNVHNEKALEQLWFPGNRYFTALAIAVALVVPNFCLMFTDEWKETRFEMGKSVRTHMKVNLFRKYLNYTDASKEQVPVQDMAGAMDAEIPEMVDGGSVFVFKAAKSLGKIVIVAYFLEAFISAVGRRGVVDGYDLETVPGVKTNETGKDVSVRSLVQVCVKHGEVSSAKDEMIVVFSNLMSR